MKTVLLALGLLILSACATPPPTNSVIVQCLPLKAWTDAEQDQLRKEYDALPDKSEMKEAFKDYIAMRDADKACTRTS